MVIVIYIAVILFWFGCYQLFGVVNQFPSGRASRLVLNAVPYRKNKKKENIFNLYFLQISNRIAEKISLRPEQKEKLELAIELAGMNITPEAYLMQAALWSGIVFLFLLPVIFYKITIWPLLLVFPAAAFFYGYQSALHVLDTFKSDIEDEIFRFVLVAGEVYSESKGIEDLLLRYLPVAGEPFQKEIRRMLEIKDSIGADEALRRLQTRLKDTSFEALFENILNLEINKTEFLKTCQEELCQEKMENYKRMQRIRVKQIQWHYVFMVLCIILLHLAMIAVRTIQY